MLLAAPLLTGSASASSLTSPSGVARDTLPPALAPALAPALVPGVEDDPENSADPEDSAGSEDAADDPAAEEATPLSVELTSMTPAQIPARGAITLSGVVQNDSDEDWVDVNVTPFVSGTPITTRDELVAASRTAANVAVGERLTDEGTYVSVGDLGPDESASFSLRLPVDSLLIAGDPGVYWIGVHALGANTDGRDLVADGRARTFVPLLTRQQSRTRSVPVSVVLPMRERARRAADGSLNGPARWANLTSADGRLTRLVDFGASAGTAPVSWTVDAAVLDALADFGAGNPPISLGTPVTSFDPDEQPQPDSGPSPGTSPSATPSTRPGSPDQEERARAVAVLEAFLATARTQDLYTTGYSDPDVAALARRRPGLISRADDLAATRLAARGLNGTPTVAPPTGYFDPDLLPEIPTASLILLSDHGRLTAPTLSRLPSGHELVLTDARTQAGGPAPNDALGPLSMRQRILAEAALEAAKGDAPTRPIVVTLPGGWDPGPYWRQADFFDGLQTTWLRLAPVPRTPTTAYDAELAYDIGQLDQELGDSNVAATRALARTSDVLDDLLATESDVTDRLVGAALQGSSYNARRRPRSAAKLVRALDAATRNQINRVQVTGSDFVTLSGGSGSLTVTLVNGLEQPITVGLRARTDSPEVEVEIPEPVSMQAGERTTLRLQVSSGVGVHEVTLLPVTVDGKETGTPLTFSLRTSQVGRLIWYIIIAGGTLLAVMIVRRIVLRIRSHRWRQEEPR